MAVYLFTVRRKGRAGVRSIGKQVKLMIRLAFNVNAASAATTGFYENLWNRANTFESSVAGVDGATER